MSNTDTATNTIKCCSCGTNTTPASGTKRFALTEYGNRYDIVDATDARAALEIAIANFRSNEDSYANGDRITVSAYEIDEEDKYLANGDQMSEEIEVMDGFDPEDEDGAEEEQM